MKIKQIITFLLITTVLLSCNFYRKGCTSISSYKKEKQIKKGVFIKLKSAEYFSKDKKLKYSFTIENNTPANLYFPIIKNHPLFSMRGVGANGKYVPDSIYTTALYVRFFDVNNNEITPPILIKLHPYSYYDSFYKVVFNSRWERRNYKLMNKYKKQGKPVKNGYNWAIKYFLIKKEPVIVKKNQSENFKLQSDISPSSELSLFFSQDYGIYNHIKDVKYTQVYIYCDSIDVKKSLLLKKDLDSLSRKKIKLFQGFAKSNTIPLMVDED